MGISDTNGHIANDLPALGAHGARRVSVIVPVRNDSAGLRQVLRCLEAQTLPRDQFEVVIGDDGSTDGALAGMATPDDWVRVTPGPPRTSYAARNRAVAVAHSGVLAFCDSDCLPEPDWLAAGLAALERADVVAGEVTFVAPARPSVWSLLTMDNYLDQERNVRTSRGVTANLFIKRAVFDLCHGFDPSLPSGGDYDFVRRAVAHGARLIYAPEARVYHPTIDGAGAYLRKVWNTNRWAAARRARDGSPLTLDTFITFFPFVGVMRARHDAQRPVLRLVRPRIAASGVTLRLADELAAMSMLYVCVAYVGGMARLRGWLDGRRLAQERAAQRQPATSAE